VPTTAKQLRYMQGVLAKAAANPTLKLQVDQANDATVMTI
jgi:hypothetical protein